MNLTNNTITNAIDNAVGVRIDTLQEIIIASAILLVLILLIYFEARKRKPKKIVNVNSNNIHQWKRKTIETEINITKHNGKVMAQKYSNLLFQRDNIDKEIKKTKDNLIDGKKRYYSLKQQMRLVENEKQY